MIFQSLVNNAAILLVLSSCYTFAARRWQGKEPLGQVVRGLLFGGVVIGVMLLPLQLAPGLVFDTRSVVIAVSGLFGGPLTAAITVLISCSYRIWLGGIGVAPGVATAVVSGIIGVFFYYRRKNWSHPNIPVGFYLIGLLVHGAMILCMFTLPRELAWQTIRKISMPVMLLYPVVTLLLAMLLAEQEKQIHSEKQLKESEKRFRTLFEEAVDAIFVSDFDGNLQDVNPVACTNLGYSREELLALRIQDVDSTVPTREILHEFWQQHLPAGQSSTFESMHRRKDGTTFPVEIRSGFIEDEGKQLVIGISRDISERREAEIEKKKLEGELLRAQKMEAIGLMAGGVAHDLNNILAGIVGYPELLLLQLPASSTLRKPIMAIHDSGKRAAVIVEDLLTVARGAASTRMPYDLNILVQEYLDSPECKELMASHPEVVCSEKLVAKDSIISCSPIHIKKTIMNLMTNAVEAVGTRGNVTICTGNQRVGESETLKDEMEVGTYVVLTVQDNGSGIADEDREHIFEPFYTKKIMGRSGTGLGLSIVWNTIQDHNGRIFVDSSVKGTSFQLYLPVSKAERILSSEKDTAAGFAHENEHILVVDDEPQLRDIASQMLLSLGYIVHCVSSGELAVEFVKNNPVDLIVMDMLMAPGMNGRQTYEEILALYPGQKAIMASGFSKSDDVKATLLLGASGFIKKPYAMKQLGQAVKAALMK